MYAVIRTGGKQYTVSPGDVVAIEKIPGEQGDKVNMTDVLLVDDGKEVKVGRPLVAGAAVTLEIVQQEAKGPKLIIFKKTRRQGHQKKKGHRQHLTKVLVKEISA